MWENHDITNRLLKLRSNDKADDVTNYGDVADMETDSENDENEGDAEDSDSESDDDENVQVNNMFMALSSSP